MFGSSVGLNCWGHGNTGTPVVLMTWEPGNTENKKNHVDDLGTWEYWKTINCDDLRTWKY